MKNNLTYTEIVNNGVKEVYPYDNYKGYNFYLYDKFYYMVHPILKTFVSITYAAIYANPLYIK
jgi:hypothetical protein